MKITKLLPLFRPVCHPEPQAKDQVACCSARFGKLASQATRSFALLRMTAVALATLCVLGAATAQTSLPDVSDQRPVEAKALTDTTSAKPASRADQTTMEAQLRVLVDAYERNDLKGFQGKLDPALPGFSRVMDAVRADAAAQTRPRILFTDQTWSIGPNVSMLQAHFEKRYFDARDLKPQLVTGQVVMLFTRAGEGWRLSTITGENPFVSRAAAACSTGQIRVVSTGAGDLAPVVVEVTDADLSGVNEIQIEVGTNRADREIVRLAAVNPSGLFRGQIGVRRVNTAAQVTAGNGAIELFGDATLVARYNDQCATAARSALVVSASDIRRDPGVLGTLACRLPTALNFFALAATAGTQATPLIIELNDADLAAQSTVDVTLRSSGGDSETITLASIGTGRFMGNSVTLRAGTTLTPVPRNGVVEINGAVRFTVDYADQKSGVVGQIATVNAVCGDVALGTPPVVAPPVVTPPVVTPPVVVPPVVTPPVVTPPIVTPPAVSAQLAQLRCSVNFDSAVFAATSAATIPVALEVYDPDLIAMPPRGDVTVVLFNADGDREVFALNPVGAGRYGLSAIPVRSGSPGASNGLFEFLNSGAIRAEYYDTTSPSGGTQTVNQSCGNFTRLARLATVSIAPSGIAVGSPSSILLAAGISAPCNIVVRDPDLTAASSVPVRVTTTQLSSGKVDIENFTLPAVSPGVFQRPMCTYVGYTNATALFNPNPISGNGAIDLGGGASSITVSYTDTTVPGGGSQVISATATVNN